MGGVLIEWNPHLFCERFGISDKNDQDVIVNNTVRQQSWHDYDQGLITINKLINLSKDRVPDRLKKECVNFIKNWNLVSYPVKGMEELLKELKSKGYRIYLLSNAGYNQPNYFKKYPYTNIFDGKIVSCFYKIRKPDKEIFELIVKKYKLNKEECVFIDDYEINVKGSNDAGIKAILFKNAIDLRKDLKEIGVEI